MLTRKDVEHLAMLARIDVAEDEADQIAKDLDGILTYVSEISAVAVESTEPAVGMLQNVLRKDESPRIGGEYTDAILENAPDTENGYLKVSQIM